MITDPLATNRATALRLSATSVEGSGRLGQHAQKAKMLETPGTLISKRAAQDDHQLSARAAPSLPEPNASNESAQTLKPRARSWSRPSSVIISMPHGGIQTQLITHRSTKPSSADWV